LRKQAKDLLRLHRSGDPAAVARVAAGHPVDGLLTLTPGAPLRLSRTDRFWVSILEASAPQGLEGRLLFELREVAAVQPAPR
jgi:hypothetical protein